MVAELLEQKRVYLPLFGYIPKKRIARLKQYMWVCNYIYIYIFYLYMYVCSWLYSRKTCTSAPHAINKLFNQT